MIDKVAIYFYVEHFESRECFDGEAPTIYGLGPYAVTHKRHYAQQCEYSICQRRIDGSRDEYSSHETAVFAGNTAGQGPVTKYVLPASEREKVLKVLQHMNITAFSLFGSEESLMETLARIIHEHFYCNRRSAATTGLRPAGSTLGPSTYCTSTPQVLGARCAGLATRLSDFATNRHE